MQCRYKNAHDAPCDVSTGLQRTSTCVNGTGVPAAGLRALRKLAAAGACGRALASIAMRRACAALNENVTRACRPRSAQNDMLPHLPPGCPTTASACWRCAQGPSIPPADTRTHTMVRAMCPPACREHRAARPETLLTAHGPVTASLHDLIASPPFIRDQSIADTYTTQRRVTVLCMIVKRPLLPTKCLDASPKQPSALAVRRAMWPNGSFDRCSTQGPLLHHL
jgi:hypothetical protein